VKRVHLVQLERLEPKVLWEPVEMSGTLERPGLQDCRDQQVLPEKQVLPVREEWTVQMDLLECKVRVDVDGTMLMCILY